MKWCLPRPTRRASNFKLPASSTRSNSSATNRSNHSNSVSIPLNPENQEVPEASSAQRNIQVEKPADEIVADKEDSEKKPDAYQYSFT